MIPKGRSVRIYLVDGEPSGVLVAEIMNWTGKILVAPRTQLSEMLKRQDSSKTGVYLLSGEDLDTGADTIYIGESDDVGKRLVQHNGDEQKAFWTRTAIVVSKDDNLTKAHVRFLEQKLIQLAVNAKRSKVVNIGNTNTTDTINLPEADVADMEFFLSQVQMLLPVVGLNFAQPTASPKPQLVQPDVEIAPRFEANVRDERETIGKAFAQEINGEFIVFEGSVARRLHVPSLQGTYLQKREQLIKEGKLTEDVRGYKFAQNVPFSSVSMAACVISGSSVNGRDYWVVENSGVTYGEWQKRQLESAIIAQSGSPQELSEV